MATPAAPSEIDPTTRRKLAAHLFNHVWTLLESENRTPEPDDEMLHAAHASRYHWGEIGEPDPSRPRRVKHVTWTRSRRGRPGRRQRSTAALDGSADPDDREIMAGDLATLVSSDP